MLLLTNIRRIRNRGGMHEEQWRESGRNATRKSRKAGCGTSGYGGRGVIKGVNINTSEFSLQKRNWRDRPRG